jgi:integrase
MSLKWEDIDLRSRILTARNTKNHRDHTLPIPDILVRLLRERKPDTGKSPYVFPGKDLTVRIRDIDDSRFRVIDESGIKFTIHDLRRTFATIAAEMGIPPYLLKKLLNHKSGDVTEGYVISTVEILRNPLQKIAKRIEDLCRMKREEEDVQEESA